MVTSNTPPEESMSCDLGPGKRLLQLGRQTGGPGPVVSNDAELDREFHAALPIRE